MTPGTSPSPTDSYAELFARVAPASITSEADAEAVQRQIDGLIDQGALSPAERKLLSLLGDLMLAWEGDRYDLPTACDTRVAGRVRDAPGRVGGTGVPHQGYRLRSPAR